MRSTPVALMEAQAAGLPVVAPEVGGVAEVVVDGASVYVVPPGDATAIADKLETLLENRGVWESMGRHGRAHIEAHVDIEQLNDRLVGIYEAVLAAAPSS